MSASKIRFGSVDDYIDAQPDTSRQVLRRVRRCIRKAVPSAEETIAYNMPAYKLGGVSFLHLAAWKAHYALYAASESLLKAFGKELRPYTIEKGTIRFPYDEAVPERLIERIAAFRARELR